MDKFTPQQQTAIETAKRILSQAGLTAEIKKNPLPVSATRSGSKCMITLHAFQDMNFVLLESSQLLQLIEDLTWVYREIDCGHE